MIGQHGRLEKRALEEVLPLAAQFALIAGPFLSMVDTNVVNVAVPAMLKEFDSTIGAVQWVLSAYLLASGGALVCSPYLSKRYGPNRVYLLSLVGFTIASALCASAPSLEFLIVARTVQGALGAVMVPLAMDMLLGREGGARKISPVFGVMLFLAPALGPTLGGVLISLAGWPAVFLINIPLGIGSTLLVRRAIRPRPSTGPRPGPQFDWLGALTLGAGSVLWLYGATEGPSVGWTSMQSLPFWLCGTILLVFYGSWATRRRNPAVDLKLLRDRQTALALVIITIAGTVLFAILFLLPIFTETIQGQSATTAGLILLPQGIVTGIGTWIGDKLSKSDRDIRRTTLLGMGILTATTGSLVILEIGTPAWVVATMLSARGLALGLTIQPLLLATIGKLAKKDVPDGNTLFNVMDRIGGSVGVSLLATFFQLREESYLSARSASLSQVVQLGAVTLSAFHDTILLLTAVSGLGLLLALLLRAQPKKPTLPVGSPSDPHGLA